MEKYFSIFPSRRHAVAHTRIRRLPVFSSSIMRVTLEPKRASSHLRVFYAFERMQPDAPRRGGGGGEEEGIQRVAKRGWWSDSIDGGREGWARSEGGSWSYQEATYKIIRHVGHAHHPTGSPIAVDCI